MVAFLNPVIQYLVIPSGATSGARIVIDGVRGIVLVYDASNNLVASVAGQPILNDGFGNFIFPGVTSYDETTQLVAVELAAGQVKFQPIGNTTNQQPGSIIGTNTLGEPSNIAPVMQLSSPDSSIAGLQQVILELWGQSPDGTSKQQFRLYDLSGNDADVQVTGTIRYGQSTWQGLPFAANWTNGPFAPAKFIRDGNGMVKFTGMIQFTGGATGAPITLGTLPAGFRPDRSINIPLQDSPGTTTNPATFTFQLGTNGVISITNFAGTIASGHLFSLEDIAFSLTQTP